MSFPRSVLILFAFVCECGDKRIMLIYWLRMYSRGKLRSEYSVLNSISRTLTWYVCVHVYVCVWQSKASKEPHIDALAVWKIVFGNRRASGVFWYGSDWWSRSISRTLIIGIVQLSCDIPWTPTQLSLHRCNYGIIVSCSYSPWATRIYVLWRSCHFLSHRDAVETSVVWWHRPGQRSAYPLALVLD